MFYYSILIHLTTVGNMVVKLSRTIFALFFMIYFVKSQNCHWKYRPSDVSCSEDAGSSQGVWVVRPKPLPRPSLTLPLYGSAFKGPCFRRQTIVKPAVIVNPIYLQESTTTCPHTYDQPSSKKSSPSNLTPTCVNRKGYQPIDVSKAYEKACSQQKNTQSIPADAVSLAIAYKLAQSNFDTKVSEDKLSYGFKKLPVEIPCPKIVPQKITKRLLPEGSLLAINGEVVELKHPKETIVTAEDLEEEAVEDLVDMVVSEESCEQAAPVKKPSLSEIGYAPAKIKSSTFVDVPSFAGVPSSKSHKESFASWKPSCNDGFQSGSIVVKDISCEEDSKSISLLDSCEVK